MIEHLPVESSSIKHIGYDPETKELHVTFHDTGKYVYHNVPQETYDGLMASSSKGKFLHHNVKKQHPVLKW